MPADPVAPVDQGDADIGVVGEGVGETHPHGAGSHHQVVGVNGARHGSTLSPGARRVHGFVDEIDCVGWRNPVNPGAPTW